jgi:hypothetical protein
LHNSPYADSSEEEGDDDIPLSSIAARRAATNPSAIPIRAIPIEEDVRVRVRRGSEGYEVRPVGISRAMSSEEDGEWDRMEDEDKERDSEDSLDDYHGD